MHDEHLGAVLSPRCRNSSPHAFIIVNIFITGWEHAGPAAAVHASSSVAFYCCSYPAVRHSAQKHLSDEPGRGLAVPSAPSCQQVSSAHSAHMPPNWHPCIAAAADTQPASAGSQVIHLYIGLVNSTSPRRNPLARRPQTRHRGRIGMPMNARRKASRLR